MMARVARESVPAPTAPSTDGQRSFSTRRGGRVTTISVSTRQCECAQGDIITTSITAYEHTTHIPLLGDTRG